MHKILQCSGIGRHALRMNSEIMHEHQTYFDKIIVMIASESLALFTTDGNKCVGKSGDRFFLKGGVFGIFFLARQNSTFNNNDNNINIKKKKK